MQQPPLRNATKYLSHATPTEVIHVEREKGQNEASAPCPNCGKDREIVAQPDGSSAPEACSNCYRSEPAKPEVAAIVTPPVSREHGTAVDGVSGGSSEPGGGEGR